MGFGGFREEWGGGVCLFWGGGLLCNQVRDIRGLFLFIFLSNTGAVACATAVSCIVGSV